MDESEVLRIEQQVEPWRKVLLDAADHLQQHGKSSCGPTDAEGRPCTITAIYVVSGCGLNGELAEQRLRDAIGGESIADWSDNTPAAEVIGKLREVANG